MAFIESVNYGKNVEPFLVIPATAAETYVPGETLYMNASGTATKCAGTTKPIYICQEAKTAVEGDVIHATLVNHEQELEVPLSASGTSLKVGNKVTIATDGLRVTATTADGTFEITKINGTATGDTVCGVFR